MQKCIEAFNMQCIIWKNIECSHDTVYSRIILDHLLKRESDGMLTSTEYRKRIYTERHFHFKSHHPSHGKRGIVRCLYQRARRVTNMSNYLKEEEKHLHKVLQSNGYDNATIRAGSKELPSRDHNTEQEKGLILNILYIAGLRESIQRVRRDIDIKTAFISRVRHYKITSY